jgi:hypothetical protein
MERLIEVAAERKSPAFSINPDAQLNPASKRLLLSAHLSLMFKKLRRGVSVEEQELLALLPFTVPNGWQPETETEAEPGDQRWLQLVESARALG